MYGGPALDDRPASAAVRCRKQPIASAREKDECAGFGEHHGGVSEIDLWSRDAELFPVAAAVPGQIEKAATLPEETVALRREADSLWIAIGR